MSIGITGRIESCVGDGVTVGRGTLYGKDVGSTDEDLVAVDEGGGFV